VTTRDVFIKLGFSHLVATRVLTIKISHLRLRIGY
jgi:hypothetical protein